MPPETKTATEVTVIALTNRQLASIFRGAGSKGRNNFTASLRRVNPSYLLCPPHLLCSGLVVRYQFKTYPKPDRTDPPSVSWSHNRHCVVTPLWGEGTYHVRHRASYRAVGRGVVMPIQGICTAQDTAHGQSSPLTA